MRDQQIARLDLGVVAHVHLEHAAGDLRRDLRDVGLDVGVLGRDVAAAPQPEQQRGQHHRHGHADQQHAACSRCGGVTSTRTVPSCAFAFAAAAIGLPAGSCSASACSLAFTRVMSRVSCRRSSADRSPSASSTVASAIGQMAAWMRSASAVRCRRLMRRSLLSSRRSSQPLASMRSISRPAEAFSISSRSATLRLAQARPPVHARDDQPLRARQAEGAHAPLEHGAHAVGPRR